MSRLSNAYIFSVVDGTITCAQETFRPPAGTATVDDVGKLTRWQVGAPPEQRERCFYCRASAVNAEVRLLGLGLNVNVNVS